MPQAKLFQHIEKGTRAMDRVAGIDPSLARGCAVAILDFEQDIVHVETTPRLPKAATDDHLAVREAALIIGILQRWDVEVVGVEDQFAPLASGGSRKERKAQQGRAQSMVRLSNFSGALRALLLQAGLTPVKIAPATGKKALTGNGRAGDSEMHRAALDLYGERGLSGKASIDECHALGIGIAAEEKIGEAR
jgi:Holliday junction resolvasome RuvABC endonuclease subunit